jgi:peptidoglycan/LPS O-acetylase OafA/YrhL
MYAQNWVGIFHYPAQMLLTPYWSLAVEEQFYLIWPLVVWRFGGKRLFRVIAVACVSAVLLRIGCMAAGVSAEAIYANTLTRVDSLLIGAACALAVRDRRRLDALRRHARWLWLAPVAPFLAVHLLAPSQKTTHPAVQGLGFTVIALSYAGVLLAALLGGNPLLLRFLRSRTMRIFGKYSYAMYLWHFPMMRLVRTTLVSHINIPGPLRMLAMIAATLLAAVCSYQLVERRFLSLKNRFEPRLPAATPTALSAAGEGLPQAAQNAAGG